MHAGAHLLVHDHHVLVRERKGSEKPMRQLAQQPKQQPLQTLGFWLLRLLHLRLGLGRGCLLACCSSSLAISLQGVGGRKVGHCGKAEDCKEGVEGGLGGDGARQVWSFSLVGAMG